MRQHKTNSKIILPVLLGVFCSSLVFFNSNTNALDYQNSTNIQFTFNPTLSISVSDDLIIDELMPGTYSDSNIVDVNVSTNSVAGYSLSATVGTNSTNNRLTHSSDSNTYFSSLSSNVSDLSSFTDNTWGYSYSVDNGTNWISGNAGNTSTGYNGLPQDTNTNASQRGNGGITLINSSTPADSKVIKFKIGAKAGSNQAAGTYTNTINFYAITKVPPISISDAFAAAGKSQYNGYYKMQDMSAGICNAVQTIDEDSQTELIDIRDGEIYKVAKLKDNRCWMVKNLNIAGGITLSSDDTDFNSNYAIPSTNGWTIIGDKLQLPASSLSGFTNDNYAYVYNSGSTTDCGEIGQNTPCFSYYSWDVATLGSGRNINADDVDAPYSVCPKGWRLPISGSRNNSGWKRGDIYALATSYGANLENNNVQHSSVFYNNAGPNTTPNFILAGGYGDGIFHELGEAGYYWSATSTSVDKAYNLNFYQSVIYIANNSYRKKGYSVRCIARDEAGSINDLVYLQDFANLSSDELTTVKSSMTPNQQYTLKDKRDGNDYTIKKINGEVWMTQNLRYIGDTGSSSGTMTIGNNNSNVENKSITLYSLNSSNAGNFNPYSGHCDSTNGYNYACVYDSGNETTGVWYNYAAATAGTITGSSNSTPATSDICPAGWHLPTGPNTTVNTDINKLVGNVTSGLQAATTGLTTFNAIASGAYYYGALSSITNGYWWSINVYDSQNRYYLLYNNESEHFSGDWHSIRYNGYSIRCVMSS